MYFSKVLFLSNFNTVWTSRCFSESTESCIDLRKQATLLSESVNKNISELRKKQMEEVIAFSKSHGRKKHEDNDEDQPDEINSGPV